MELARFLQRGPTKYFLQKKILFHVDLIKMFSLISLFLRFPSYLYMAYLFKLPSRLIVERHLPTIAGADPGGAHPAIMDPPLHCIRCVRNWVCWRDPYYPRPILRVHCNSFRQKLLNSHSVELIRLVILWVFFPFRLLSAPRFCI